MQQCAYWGGGDGGGGVFTSYSCMWILMETTKISKTTKIKSHKVRYKLNKVVISGLALSG